MLQNTQILKYQNTKIPKYIKIPKYQGSFIKHPHPHSGNTEIPKYVTKCTNIPKYVQKYPNTNKILKYRNTGLIYKTSAVSFPKYRNGSTLSLELCRCACTQVIIRVPTPILNPEWPPKIYIVPSPQLSPIWFIFNSEWPPKIYIVAILNLELN